MKLLAVTDVFMDLAHSFGPDVMLILDPRAVLTALVVVTLLFVVAVIAAAFTNPTAIPVITQQYMDFVLAFFGKHPNSSPRPEPAPERVANDSPGAGLGVGDLADQHRLGE